MGLEDDLRLELKFFIASAGLSQAAVARELNVSQKHLGQMLNGKAPLGIQWVDRIAGICGFKISISSRETEVDDVPDVSG